MSGQVVTLEYLALSGHMAISGHISCIREFHYTRALGCIKALDCIRAIHYIRVLDCIRAFGCIGAFHYNRAHGCTMAFHYIKGTWLIRTSFKSFCLIYFGESIHSELWLKGSELFVEKIKKAEICKQNILKTRRLAFANTNAACCLLWLAMPTQDRWTWP